MGLIKGRTGSIILRTRATHGKIFSELRTLGELDERMLALLRRDGRAAENEVIVFWTRDVQLASKKRSGSFELG